jgi:enoyl-CoA hydratase/carnithine racemase
MNLQTRPAPADPADSVLRREDIDRIAVLTLNRPSQRNALSEALLLALLETSKAIAADKSVRGVVIAANGPAFCAGHDLKELTARRSDPDGGRAFFRYIMTTCAAFMQSLVALPQPVIAAVNGTASAAGCQLVATCDLAIAASTAKFATPGVDIGLFCSTPMVALSRNIPRKQAMEMLLTGEAIGAERARDLGLVNRLVTPGTEREEAIALARHIASKSSYTVKTGKQAFYRQADMPLAAAYDYAAEVMTENMMARDAEEGICAFIDKRNPRWEDL